MQERVWILIKRSLWRKKGLLCLALIILGACFKIGPRNIDDLPPSHFLPITPRGQSYWLRASLNVAFNG